MAQLQEESGSKIAAQPEGHEDAVMLPGHALIVPLAQGDCDMLCGLYSIINALRLALAPIVELSESDGKELFRAGLRYLEQQGKLGRVLHKGMSIKLWRQLARHMKLVAEAHAGFPLSMRRLFPDKCTFSRAEVFGRLEQALQLGQVPLVLVVGNARHYTALNGFTSDRFLAADSAYLPRIFRSECRLSRKGRRRFRLPLDSVLVISATS